MKSFLPHLYVCLILFSVSVNPMVFLASEDNVLPTNSDSWQYSIKNLYTTELVANFNDDIVIVGKDPLDNIILIKLNSTGSLMFKQNLTWILNDGYYYFRAISVDSNNNIYVSGDFYSYFNELDIFLIKFDDLGNFLWIHSWGGYDMEYESGIDIDNNDNIYISGYTNSFSEEYGVWNIFLVKYNNNGDFGWSRIWDSNTTTSNSNDLATDSLGNVYIAGHFGYKGCLIKYNYNGTLQWNFTLDFFSQFDDLAIDSQNNIYTITRGSSYYTINILKYNQYGQFLWNKSYTIKDYLASSIILDHFDNIYIGGSISLDLGSDAYDMFIMKCNNSGSFQWYIQFGTCYYENYRGITIDSFGNIYVLSESRNHPNNDLIIILFKNPTNGLKLYQQQTISGYYITLLCSIILISTIIFLICKFRKPD